MATFGHFLWVRTLQKGAEFGQTERSAKQQCILSGVMALSSVQRVSARPNDGVISLLRTSIYHRSLADSLTMPYSDLSLVTQTAESKAHRHCVILLNSIFNTSPLLSVAEG